MTGPAASGGPVLDGEEAEMLPPLPLEEWEDTKTTLHLYLQVLGKIRLAATPRRNHWWNASLNVTSRGLATGRMVHGSTSFEIELDVLDPAVAVRTDRGQQRRLPLGDGLSVARFSRELFDLLADLGVPVAIKGTPYGVPTTTPFAADDAHAAYDAAAVQRFWRALLWSDWVLQEFAGWSTGKTSPVQLFWHSLDLAVSRFSGRRVPEGTPDGTPDADQQVDPVSREAYSHEVVSFGFWAGDAQTRHASYYSYTAPEPAGLTARALRPSQAAWQSGPTGSLALLGYDDVRAAASPRQVLLSFLQSAYEAGADAAGWDRAALATSWAPTG